jgi:glycosyltransferase involved in cell wall biosynthesis
MSSHNDDESQMNISNAHMHKPLTSEHCSDDFSANSERAGSGETGRPHADKPRIAVTCAGDPSNLTSFSGTPASLLKALAELDVEALALRGDLGAHGQAWVERALLALHLRPADLRNPGGLRQRRRDLRTELILSPVLPPLRALAVKLRVAHIASLEGIVQFGVAFDLPSAAPAVTLEDATFRQIRDGYDWWWTAGKPASVMDKIERQTRVRYERARACTFMSQWAATSAIRDYGVPAEKVRVVGVGRNHTPPCPSRDWSSPRALFVGLDWERKNGDAVLRAFARLRQRWHDARLDVAGNHPPLDMPGVHGHGPLSRADPEQSRRLEGLFAQATFFVLPTIEEPAGIVFAEAQAAGIASIASSSGGSATIVGDAGIIVDPHDDDAIAEAMLTLAEPATAARLGALALERAPLFTWRAVAERLLRALAPEGLDVEHLTPFLPDP